MYKIRYFVNSNILINIYYALAYPFLLYGINISGFASDYLLNSLYILQKRIVCMITFKDKLPLCLGPLAHSTPLFYELKFLNVYDIFKLQLGKFVFESHHDIGPNQFHDFYTHVSEIHNISTRYATSGKFYVNFARTTQYGLKSIKNAGTKLWSTLPIKIKNSTSSKLFCKQYKLFLIECYKD